MNSSEERSSVNSMNERREKINIGDQKIAGKVVRLGSEPQVRYLHIVG